MLKLARWRSIVFTKCSYCFFCIFFSTRSFNFRLVMDVQTLIHLVDNTLVWTASIVGRKDKMWPRMLSCIWLIMFIAPYLSCFIVPSMVAAFESMTTYKEPSTQFVTMLSNLSWNKTNLYYMYSIINQACKCNILLGD